MMKLLVAIFYGSQCVTNLAVAPDATDAQIREKALADHEVVPLCDIGELPGTRRARLLYGEIRRYNMVPIKPRKGHKLTYKGQPAGTVLSTDGNTCFYKTLEGESTCFIWQFANGLNRLFTWV